MATNKETEEKKPEQARQERDWFQKTKTPDNPDRSAGGDWSGSSWSGERTSGRNQSGERER
jgi:hypothetical protein